MTASNKTALQGLLGTFAGLEDGLEVLKELGKPIAHPQSLPVSPDALATAIEAAFTTVDPARQDVEAVLQCLQFLADDMSETLFVTTM